MCINVSNIMAMLQIEERLSAMLHDTSYPWEPTPNVSGYSRPNWPIICSDCREKIRIAKWGFIPEWVKDKKKADKIALMTLNARAETAESKPSFRNSVNRRCLIPVTGFFEPHHKDKKVFPYLFKKKDNSLFALGGFYCESDLCEAPSNRSFTIITIDADEETAKIHNKKKRMPLWIPESEWSNWLDSKLNYDQWRKISKTERPFIYFSVSQQLYKKNKTILGKDLLKSVRYDELDQEELF